MVVPTLQIESAEEITGLEKFLNGRSILVPEGKSF